MPIPFLPDEFGVEGMSFVPDPTIEVTPLLGGRVLSADLGPTLWRCRVRSSIFNEQRLGVARAWYDSILSLTPFFAYDKLRQYPLQYRNGWGNLLVGGVPFNGTCQISTISSSKLVTLKTLPASGFVLSPGDYLAFDYGANGSRALHRIGVGGSTVDGIVTVEVRPFVRVGWAVNATVYLYRAAAQMIIVPGSYSEEMSPPARGRISFDAVQSL